MEGSQRSAGCRNESSLCSPERWVCPSAPDMLIFLSCWKVKARVVHVAVRQIPVISFFSSAWNMGNVLPMPPWSSSSSLCQYTSEWANTQQGTGSQRIMVRIDLAQSVRGQWGGDTRIRWSEKGAGRGRRNGLTVHCQTFTESPGSSLTLHSCLLLFLESRGWSSLIIVSALGGQRRMPVLQCGVLWAMGI